MKPATMLNVDFNSLRVLRYVYENQSFSIAAEKLGVSQSVVSYTIDKLRTAFSDPLFVRQGRRIVPTDRCVIVVEAARRIRDEIEFLAGPMEFDPAKVEHTIKIACAFYEKRIVIPPLLKEIRKQAPRLSVEVINSNLSGEELLKRAEAELYIGSKRPKDESFFCRRVFEDKYVCIMDPRNPLAQSALNKESYIEAVHASVFHNQSSQPDYLRQLNDDGIVLNSAAKVSSFAGIEDLVLGTDLIATVPYRLVQDFADSVYVTALPFSSSIGVDLIWATRTHRSLLHIWLRDLIAKLA